MVLDGEFSQKCPVSTGFLQGSILGPTLFFSLLYINDLSDDICNIAIYVDDTKFYSKCDQASDLWQQLDLAAELQSKLLIWSKSEFETL